MADTVNSINALVRTAAPIVPSDTVALAVLPRAIYVDTEGTIVMRGKDDPAERMWRDVPGATLLPFRTEYVLASGTTAADLLARS